MVFQYINICQVPREMLKTSAYGLGFQHLPRDLANVNAWKTMFDPYIGTAFYAITTTTQSLCMPSFRILALTILEKIVTQIFNVIMQTTERKKNG